MGGQEDDGALAAATTAMTSSTLAEAPASELASVDCKEEDSPSPGAVASNRGLAGLAFSHVKVEEFASIPGEPDDDDVEPTTASPLVALGHGRDSADFEQQDPEAVDLDPSSRARDLISRDLLDELSHEPSNWSENRHPPTPPHGGFDTPSEPGTPRATQSQPYYHKPSNEGLSSVDQWDWKTDAPEFVPGGLKGMTGFADSQVVGPFSQPGTWAMQSGPAQPQQQWSNGGAANAGVDETARLSELRGNYEWQLQAKAEELREMQQRFNQQEIENAQVRASWEVERRGMMRQIGHYRAVLERYCIPVDDAGNGYNLEDPRQYFPVFEPSAPSQWPTESTSLQAPVPSMRPAKNSSAAERQAPHSSDTRSLRDSMRPGGGASTPPPPPPTIVKRVADGEQAKSSLDSKMRQLNSLLREDSTPAQKARQPSPDSNSHDNDPSQGGGNNYTGSSIASTLRSMFPHATIRTKTMPGENGEEEDDDVDYEPGVLASENGLAARERMRPQSSSSEAAASIAKMIDALEDAMCDRIDDRARKALQALSPSAALEAVSRAENIVRQDHRNCNLSSVLQSVCKNMDARPQRAAGSRSKPSTGDARHPGGGQESLHKDGGRGRRARRLDEDERDAFVSSESEGDVSSKAQERSREVQKAVQQADVGGASGRRSSAGSKSWADLEDGDDDAADAWEKDSDPWTPELVDEVARRGFELRWKGDQLDLKILMSQLEPPLTETGMERYCRWLRTRLSNFREEHGQDALWSCRGEVDFSHNQMSNQMVWMLLETLAQHEVHTALLKLYSNRISQGGVLAICEFIRQNERPEALQELHLSHNEIDDESALELLRTLKSQRPRYPPQRSADRSGNLVHVPVWLRLSHNRIREPAKVLRIAEEEGVTMCTAWDRHVCGTSKCNQEDNVPIVHLYAFNVQDLPKQERRHENGDGGKRH